MNKEKIRVVIALQLLLHSYSFVIDSKIISRRIHSKIRSSEDDAFQMEESIASRNE